MVASIGKFNFCVNDNGATVSVDASYLLSDFSLFKHPDIDNCQKKIISSPEFVTYFKIWTNNINNLESLIFLSMVLNIF